MEVEEQPISKIQQFYQNVVDPTKKAQKVIYNIQLRVKLMLPERVNLSQQWLSLQISKVIKRHLGIVGTVTIPYEVTDISVYDAEATISLSQITLNNYSLFWSALAFQGAWRIQIININYKAL